MVARADVSLASAQSSGLNILFHLFKKLKKKKERVTIFILDKADFRKRKIIRDKGVHYIIIKGSNLQEDIILNVYVSNKRTSKYMRQKLIELKGRTI